MDIKQKEKFVEKLELTLQNEKARKLFSEEELNRVKQILQNAKVELALNESGITVGGSDEN